MTDDSTKLPPGGSVEILLKRRRRQPVKRAATPPDEKQRGILHVDDEPPRYLRRPGRTVTFHDLGTRLRSVAPNTLFTDLRYRAANDRDVPDPQDDYINEYVEQEMDMSGIARRILLSYDTTAVDVVRHETYEISFSDVLESQFRRQERIMLGSRVQDATDPVDPFGYSPANGSGRNLPHAMELYHRTLFPNWIGVAAPNEVVRAPSPVGPDGQSLWLQNILLNPPEFEFRPNTLIQAGTDEWKARAAGEDDDDERWNPLNLNASTGLGLVPRTYVHQPKFYQSAPAGHLMVGFLWRNFLLPDGTRAELDDNNEPLDAPLYWIFSPDGPSHRTLPSSRVEGYPGLTATTYWGFDTGDLSKYKVTGEPTFPAPSIPYKFGGKNVRIYLRPRQQAFALLNAQTDDPIYPQERFPHVSTIISAWASRFPVYPSYQSLISSARRSTLSVITIAEEPVERLFFLSHSPTTATGEAFSAARIQRLPTLPSGSLVGVIVQDHKPYYVWQITGVSWPIGNGGVPTIIDTVFPPA